MWEENRVTKRASSQTSTSYSPSYLTRPLHVEEETREAAWHDPLDKRKKSKTKQHLPMPTCDAILDAMFRPMTHHRDTDSHNHSRPAMCNVVPLSIPSNTRWENNKT